MTPVKKVLMLVSGDTLPHSEVGSLEVLLQTNMRPADGAVTVAEVPFPLPS